MTASLKVPHQAHYQGDVMSQMFHFQKENIMTDFKISVKDKTIQCHRLVLAAVCPYFASLFNSGMKESLSGEVSMDTLNYEALHKVVQYMYGHTITISLKSVADLFEICEILQFESLKNQLCLIVNENIAPDNCIQFWKIAETYNLTEIASTASRMMVEKFSMVAKSQDFKDLTLAELLDYVSIGKMANRDHVLAGCFDWVNVDKVERQKSLVDLIGHVKLDKCSQAVLKQIYNDNKDIVSLEVAHMFVEALTSTSRTRKEPKLVVLGGMDKWEGTPNTRCWVKPDSLSSHWQEFLDIPSGYQAMHSPILCLPRGFAILCGGGDCKKNTMYDADSKSWSDLPPTPVGLHNTSAVLRSNEIVLLGGKTNKEVVSSVYSLDMNEMRWREFPKMLVEQFLPIAATVDEDIFVLYNHQNGTGKMPAPMQKYCNAQNKWSYLSSAPEQCNTRNSILISYNRSLYCFGAGHNRISAMYNIDFNTWTILDEPGETFFNSTLLVMNDTIYKAGGNGNGEASRVIEEYDIKNDCWKVCSTKLPKPLTMFAMNMVDWL